MDNISNLKLPIYYFSFNFSFFLDFFSPILNMIDVNFFFFLGLIFTFFNCFFFDHFFWYNRKSNQNLQLLPFTFFFSFFFNRFSIYLYQLFKA